MIPDHKVDCRSWVSPVRISDHRFTHDHETHEDEQYVQISIRLPQPPFIKLSRSFDIGGPKFRMHTLGCAGGFIRRWAGTRAGSGLWG